MASLEALTQGVGRQAPPFRRSGNRSAGRYDASGPSNHGRWSKVEAAPARAEGIDNLAGNVAQLGEELHVHEGRLHGIQTSQVVAMGNDLRRLTFRCLVVNASNLLDTV